MGVAMGWWQPAVMAGNDSDGQWQPVATGKNGKRWWPTVTNGGGRRKWLAAIDGGWQWWIVVVNG